MQAPLIELTSITKRFPGMTALNNVDFSIEPAEIVCLAGENGSGKSTLIKVLSGIYRPEQGRLVFDGEEIATLSPREAIARGVQVIYQDFSLFPNLTVAENLALSRFLGEKRQLMNRAEARRIGQEALDRLGVSIDLEAEVGSLSTADRQLVAIARALMSPVRLLVMDEPTTALTGREIDRLFALVREIKAKGIAVLFVSHKMREMLEISERIVIFRNGRKVAEGSTADFTEGSITKAMTGQEIGGEGYEGPPSDAPIRLAVAGLSVPGRVEDVSFSLRAGEIVGLSGLLGSGRTELALALFGLSPDHGGWIEIDGHAIEAKEVNAAIDAGIAYVPEDRLSEGLFMTQSIARNINAGVIDRLSSGPFVDKTAFSQAAEDTVSSLRIATPGIEKAVGLLSGGNQQRVVIGRWLQTGPKVLILNGPTVGVDVGSKAEIHRQLRKLAVENGLSVLMISDDVPELIQNCNRILLMHRGRLIDEIQAVGVEEDDIHARLKGLD
ncbi:sugar ABC transporter ATP-binding protein [Tianweitania sp.]|uniref:sugar ABC transporter ATP-binding protein n=1 Tax=Tianweitania sp. TaxID=2021634 RepID=UPI00289754D1|nr:sugar ABC transporter ATP-binding protein [Tianweitania sp.]